MICSTPAFILKTYDVRETSKMGTFFTRDFGKIKGLLKGIRKDPKKFSSPLSPLSLNHIVFYKKRVSEVQLVSQCDLVDEFGLTKGELRSFGFTSYIAELVDALMPLEDKHPEVFELIYDFLNSPTSRRQEARNIFQIKILALSGFKPHFDSCVVCDAKIHLEASFSYKKGGLLCPRCLYHDAGAECVSQGTIATILYIEKSSWKSCLRLKTIAAVEEQLNTILGSFLQFHVGRSLKTSSLIHEFLDL